MKRQMSGANCRMQAGNLFSMAACYTRGEASIIAHGSSLTPEERGLRKMGIGLL
jgi:hypothetical protein